MLTMVTVVDHDGPSEGEPMPDAIGRLRIAPTLTLALLALAMAAAVVVAMRYGGAAHFGAYLYHGSRPGSAALGAAKPDYLYQG